MAEEGSHRRPGGPLFSLMDLFSMFSCMLYIVYFYFHSALCCACLIGLVIEEITEEVEAVSSGNDRNSFRESSPRQVDESTGFSKNKGGNGNEGVTTNSESLHALKDDSEAIRSDIFSLHFFFTFHIRRY